MNCKIIPAQKLKGGFRLPASKSYSIRAFITAACGGESVIIAPSNCDDALVAANVLKAMGAAVKREAGGKWKITAGKKKSRLTSIDVNESGTVLRLIIPLVAAKGGGAVIKGRGTLKGRPNAFLVKTLKSMGGAVSGTGPKHGIPVRIKPSEIHGGHFSIDGSLSSQFVSALIMTFPFLKENSTLRLTGKKLVSTDYITMTLQVLKLAGISVKHTKDYRSFSIKGSQPYRGLKKFHVPSDYGLAAFPLAAAALCDSDLKLEGYFDDKFVQADGYIIPFLTKMGVRFKRSAKSISIKGPFKLKGGKFSLKDCPDLVPIMAVLALFADKRTDLVDIAHAKAKESDRISDLRRELLKIGADVRETKNSLTIVPKGTYKPGVLLDSYHDHRLAMAFTVLGLKVGVSVKDMQSTSKSYPDFVKNMRSVGAKIRRV